MALDTPPGLDIYLPLRQVHSDGLSFLRSNQFWMVRTSSDPAAFGPSFVAELRAVDPDAGLSSTGPMRQYLETSLGPRRFLLWLLAAFSLTAVVLAVTGLYGLVSYTVAAADERSACGWPSVRASGTCWAWSCVRRRALGYWAQGSASSSSSRLVRSGLASRGRRSIRWRLAS